jgi:sterol desaturase/sphingolipid hydroxylase (fatty acid hydroxylase superfamily)
MLSFLGDTYSAAYGFVNATLIRLEYPAATCVAYLALELLLPRTRNSAQSYLRGGYFVAAAIVFNTLVLTVLQSVAGIEQASPGTALAHQPAALVNLDLTALTSSTNPLLQAGGWVLATLGVAVISDFFYYWMHRAQHRISWLWRFHSVHHSVTEMSAINSYHHVAEDLFQYVAVTVPLALLLGVASGPVPWLLIVVLNTHSYFIHSSAKIDIGPLRYLFSDNRLHRIHHSQEARHLNRNFATTTPLWDVVFGTAYFPKRGEWPSVGLSDVAEPKSLRDFLLMPFRRLGGAAPASDPLKV